MQTRKRGNNETRNSDSTGSGSGTSTLAFSATDETSQKEKPDSKAEAGQKASQKVKDPVCGMEIDSKSAAGTATYKGKTYYFCSVSEKEQFEKEPAKYVK